MRLQLQTTRLWMPGRATAARRRSSCNQRQQHHAGRAGNRRHCMCRRLGLCAGHEGALCSCCCGTQMYPGQFPPVPMTDTIDKSRLRLRACCECLLPHHPLPGPAGLLDNVCLPHKICTVTGHSLGVSPQGEPQVCEGCGGSGGVRCFACDGTGVLGPGPGEEAEASSPAAMRRLRKVQTQGHTTSTSVLPTAHLVVKPLGVPTSDLHCR